MQHHADLLEPAFWQQYKDRILDGYVHDVFPYDRSRRFIHKIRQMGLDPDLPSSDMVPAEEPVDVPPLGPDVHDQGRLTGFASGGAGAD